MQDLTQHLLTQVIPFVPIRQWVLTFPYTHRMLMSSNPKLTSQILSIVIRAISGFYKRKSKQKIIQLQKPQTGSLTTIQRFGSSLNLNVHFHILFIDGVFDGNLRFIEFRPTTTDVVTLLQKIQRRVDRRLNRLGLLDIGLEDDDCGLATLNSLSVQNLVINQGEVSWPKKIGRYLDPPLTLSSGPRCTSFHGYTLHANTRVAKQKRLQLEKLCLYINRPPLAHDRVTLTSSGQVRLKLKTAFRDGTTHLEFDPINFISRLTSLIPPPRMNLVRYHGVFAARHRKRNAVTALAQVKSKNKNKPKKYRSSWADLMKKVFLRDVSHCERCGETLKLIATITAPSVCHKILRHLKLPHAMMDFVEARAPPQLDFAEIYSDCNENQEQGW